MASVTPAGQVGAWAKLVPAFGTRVNFRRFRIGIMEGCANLVGRRVPGCTPAVRKAVGAAAFNCAHCPGVLETAPHVIMECPGTQPVWREALAKATASMEGHPMQGTWAAMAPAAQRGHLLGSAAVFPMEVEQRLRGDSTRALVQGLSALNEDLFKGHAGLSEALAAEVKSRSDAKKALARAARTQAHGVQGGSACWAMPSWGGVTPTHCSGRWDLGPVWARPGLVASSGNLLGTRRAGRPARYSRPLGLYAPSRRRSCEDQDAQSKTFYSSFGV